MNIPKIKSYIDKNFEILYVDVKRYEINMSLMEEYGIESAEGIPRLLVFDANKKLIKAQIQLSGEQQEIGHLKKSLIFFKI